MANTIDYTQEDKVRAISPQDLARILILGLGSEDVSGIVLLGKKSDNTFEVIKTDDAGGILVKDGTLRTDVATILTAVNRKYSFMDFWSAPSAKITITSVAADLSFPDVIVSGLPSGLTIQKVTLIFTCRAINDTSGVANYINAASKTLRIKKSTGAWGTDDVVGITFANQSLYCVASTKEPGPAIIGDSDVKSEVDGNATYNVRSEQTNRADAILALGNNLELYDVQVGLRVFYS